MQGQNTNLNMMVGNMLAARNNVMYGRFGQQPNDFMSYLDQINSELGSRLMFGPRMENNPFNAQKFYSQNEIDNNPFSSPGKQSQDSGSKSSMPSEKKNLFIPQENVQGNQNSSKPGFNNYPYNPPIAQNINFDSTNQNDNQQNRQPFGINPFMNPGGKSSQNNNNFLTPQNNNNNFMMNPPPPQQRDEIKGTNFNYDNSSKNPFGNNMNSQQQENSNNPFDNYNQIFNDNPFEDDPSNPTYIVDSQNFSNPMMYQKRAPNNNREVEMSVMKTPEPPKPKRRISKINFIKNKIIE